MRICFNLWPFFSDQSTDTMNAYALRALLECLIDINIGYLKENRRTPGLYQTNVRYGRTHGWEPIPALYKRQVGDCKSLTCALIAQYRLRGIEALPVFRFMPNENGGNDYHILVQTPHRDGLDHKDFEDPSLKLGMSPAIVRRFYDAKPIFG